MRLYLRGVARPILLIALVIVVVVGLAMMTTTSDREIQWESLVAVRGSDQSSFLFRTDCTTQNVFVNQPAVSPNNCAASPSFTCIDCGMNPGYVMTDGGVDNGYDLTKPMPVQCLFGKTGTCVKDPTTGVTTCQNKMGFNCADLALYPKQQNGDYGP